MVEDSADLEIRIRRVFREAVEAMYPTKMFHIDVTPIADPDALCSFEMDDEVFMRWGLERAKPVEKPKPIAQNAMLALPFLPAALCGKSPAHALSLGLQWTAYRVRNHGPPRLELEAERWLNELVALGVDLERDAVIQEWESRQPRGSWIEEEGTEDVKRTPL